MKYFLIVSFILFNQNTFAYEYREAPLKDCTQLQSKCFDPMTEENTPYFLANPFVMRAQNSKKTVVLVHGLSDSPYTWRDVSIFLNQQGYNVYAVLLTGHGDKPEALFTAGNSDWLRDISKMIDFALNETKNTKTVLMGFSMGAALAVRMAAMPEYKNKISSLVLLAPAFKIQSFWGRVLCNLGVAEDVMTWARNKPGSKPWAYQSFPVHSVCELVKTGEYISQNARRIVVPVFSTLNETDEDIINSEVIKHLSEMNSPLKEIFYEGPSSVKLQSNSIQIDQYETPALRHSDIPYKNNILRDYKNPRFDQMMEKIKDFLSHSES